MPVARRLTNASATPDGLRAYTFHGCDLAVCGGHGVGDCPFCGAEGKFSVDVQTTQWRCWVCGGGMPNGGGNAHMFLRALHAAAALRSEAGLRAIATDRRLLEASTAAAWGVVLDFQGFNGTWLVPGYSVQADGPRLDQLYRRVWLDGAWRLLPTSGVWEEGKAHALHLPSGDFDPVRPNVWVCEGPWDGMALWEVARSTGHAADTNVVAVPGCGVWRDEWTEMCRGRTVTLWYDSDHPRTYVGRTVRPGYDAVQRVARKLGGVSAVRYLRWGPDGYDPARPNGWDVRDALSGHPGPPSLMVDRHAALAGLLLKVEEAPTEWSGAPTTNGRATHSTNVEARPCSTWATCEAAWAGALEWRQDMGDALAVLLAVCASTRQGGNQLFLDLIGSPGSAKTTLCRGLLVSRHCIHLENMTKLISGFKKAGDGEKDCSFLARANNRTWVTCEFDTLGSSPQYHELMGKVRRIFDGETSATYGNSDEDRLYTALRTPWVRAGTFKMIDHDQSQLGDRFLRYIIPNPDEVVKRAILRSAVRSERAAMAEATNGTAGSMVDGKTRMAHALTGGYVDWLRAHVEEMLAAIEMGDAAEEQCINLAELCADLRARPIHQDRWKKQSELHECKELPTRLARQNARLAACLAVVLNKRTVDADVLRIVRKVALDTACGHSLNIVNWLCSPNPKVLGQTYQASGGLMEGALETWTGMTVERLLNYLGFLRRIDVIEYRKVSQTNGAWLLTERVHNLYLRIMGGK